MGESKIEAGTDRGHSDVVSIGIKSAEVARRVGETVSELAALARCADLPLLAYLLDLAQSEANDRSGQPERGR